MSLTGKIAIHAADKCYKTSYAIGWTAIYPVDSVIHSSNDQGLVQSVRVIREIME